MSARDEIQTKSTRASATSWASCYATAPNASCTARSRAFVKQQSRDAAARGDDPRARAVGFLMSLYQRRLASSTYAARRSLENRVRRLEESLKRPQELAPAALPDLTDLEDIDELEDDEREHLERGLEAVRLTSSPAQVWEEIPRLQALAENAKAIEDAGSEAKLARLRDVLQQEGFFDRPTRLRTHNQKMTVAARQMALKKVCAHRS